MIVDCQQQNILKIRDKVPGHGPQVVKFQHRPLFSGSKHVLLACGCSIPISWLTKNEQLICQNAPIGGRPIMEIYHSKKERKKFWAKLFNLLRPRCAGCGERVNFSMEKTIDFNNLYCYSHCGVNRHCRLPYVWPFSQL